MLCSSGNTISTIPLKLEGSLFCFGFFPQQYEWDAVLNRLGLLVRDGETAERGNGDGNLSSIK